MLGQGVLLPLDSLSEGSPPCSQVRELDINASGQHKIGKQNVCRQGENVTNP